MMKIGSFIRKIIISLTILVGLLGFIGASANASSYRDNFSRIHQLMMNTWTAKSHKKEIIQSIDYRANHNKLSIKSYQDLTFLINWYNTRYHKFHVWFPASVRNTVANGYANLSIHDAYESHRKYGYRYLNHWINTLDDVDTFCKQTHIKPYADKYAVESAQTYRSMNNKSISSTKGLKKVENQGSKYTNGIRAEFIHDINTARIRAGVRPLKVTTALQKTANYRAPKVQYAYDHLSDYKKYPHNSSNPTDGWVHGEDTHTDGSDYLNNHHYNYHQWSANAGNFYPNGVVQGDGSKLKYDNHTAKGVADNSNDGLLNHDNCEGNKNGHRYNELNKNWKYLGVGITYNAKTGMGSYNTQFAY